MKRKTLRSPSARKSSLAVAFALMFAFMPTAFSIAVSAQENQLSLADILIALRSKKATLPDRNKILSEAITTRGTTFALTPEIEKELAGTGADTGLLNSLRHRGQIANVQPPNPAATESRPKVDPSKVEPPKSDPVVPSITDYSFYEKRADASVTGGDPEAAVRDYTRAVEMNPAAAASFLGRGTAYLAKGSYTLALADFTKVIELTPQNALAWSRRGEAHDKKGSTDLALEDYKKAFEIDPANETAKTAVEHYRSEQAKLVQKPEPVPAPVLAPVVLPEFVELGQISETRATRMVKPIYSHSVSLMRLGGEVAVELELDAEGNVTKAKAVSGNQYLRQSCEDAARRSKFKPAMIGDKALKAKARIVYNFVAPR